MPIYEYECGLCQHNFERKQSFDEEPVAICPECQSKARRVIHSIPIIFKGSGFYITDYKQNKPSTDTTPPSTKSESKEKTKSKAS